MESRVWGIGSFTQSSTVVFEGEGDSGEVVSRIVQGSIHRPEAAEAPEDDRVDGATGKHDPSTLERRTCVTRR